MFGMRSVFGLLLSVAVGAAVAGAVMAGGMTAGPAGLEERAGPVGAEKRLVPGRENGRTIPVTLWYPAESGGAMAQIGENPLFVGTPVRAGAPLTPGNDSYPLVILSHGSGGNMFNQGWLAQDLVRSGSLVVSVTHPGSTTGDASPQTALPVWRRAEDLSAVLDMIFADPVLGSRIDRRHVTAIGHSLGGYTVLAVAGARLDGARYRALCQAEPTQGDCAYFQAAGLSFDMIDPTVLEASYKDPRVTAVVAMAPGFVRAFRPDSLEGWTLPTLVIGLTGDEMLPHERNAVAFARGLKGGRLLEQPGGHFSVLPLCKPGAKALLEREPDPGDRLICDDAGEDRTMVHQAVSSAIRSFLAGL